MKSFQNVLFTLCHAVLKSEVRPLIFLIFATFTWFFAVSCHTLYSVIFGSAYSKAYNKYEALTGVPKPAVWAWSLFTKKMVNGNCAVVGCLNSR